MLLYYNPKSQSTFLCLKDTIYIYIYVHLAQFSYTTGGLCMWYFPSIPEGYKGKNKIAILQYNYTIIIMLNLNACTCTEVFTVITTKDQSGAWGVIIIYIAKLARDLWLLVNKPYRSLGYAFRLSLFTAYCH